MNLEWRSEVEERDLASIRAIVTNTGVFSEEEIGVAVELAQDRLTLGEDSDYHFLFAQTLSLTLKGEGSGEAAGGDTIVAYSCFGRIPFTDERYDLYWIATDANAQGKGIAAALLKETENAVRKLGGKKLYAETSSRAVYAPAQRFYIAQGFEEVARLKGYYADHDDKMMFAKAL